MTTDQTALRVAAEAEHRRSCHDGRFQPNCAECHGYLAAREVRLLGLIYGLLDERLPKPGDDGTAVLAAVAPGDPCPCVCRRDVEPKTGERHGIGLAGRCKDDTEPDTLVEALDGLPVGTMVYDFHGDRWSKVGTLRWNSVEVGSWGSNLLATCAPIGIESIPDACGGCFEPIAFTGAVCPTCDYRNPAPEPESVTVTLPRDVVEHYTAENWREVAQVQRDDGSPLIGMVIDALADALARETDRIEAGESR